MRRRSSDLASDERLATTFGLGFDQLLPATLATAAVDRFMHHAHLVVTEGDSYRFVQARDGKEVTPLT